MDIVPLKEVFAKVTVVAPYVPAVALRPVAIP
jgi:hypothetical protein